MSFLRVNTPLFEVLYSAHLQGLMLIATLVWAGQVEMIWPPFAGGFWGSRIRF